MLGAIIGDIVGSRFEFNNTSDFDFELFTSACDYTDDSICTFAVADAIWGVPETIKAQTLEYLPAEMRAVYERFLEESEYR